MKKLLGLSGLSFVIYSVILCTLQVNVSSCKKTVTVHDTVTVVETDTLTQTDTVHVKAVDTTFVMDVNSWDGWSYVTNAPAAPGATTYTNTADGIKMMTQAYRLGFRLLTKKEVGIEGKTIYFKWRPTGGAAFGAYALQLKYDPTVSDGVPDKMNVDLGLFCTFSAFAGYTLITDNTWHYTRISPIAGTDKYQVVTSTGNYANAGGTVVVTKEVYVYTKHGYLGLRIGDPYNTNAYMTLGECKIASN